MVYDSIIIGKGPAGIQAALYIKRANLNVLVIGKDGGSLEKAEKIENFYGQEEPITGKNLIDKGIKQAEKLGITVLQDEVVGIEFLEENEVLVKEKYIQKYKVKTLKNEYIAKTVVVATGINRVAPKIQGISNFEGRGVSYCAVCDGFFYKDKNVVVIGNGDYAISEVETLLPITNKITILTNGKQEVMFRNLNVKCNTKEILNVYGENKVEKVVFKDNSEIDVSGIFIAEGVATSIDFARRLGAQIKDNKLIVNFENMQTTVKGVFAAGDCIGETYQISKAVYDGMKAALGVIKYLK